MNNSKTSDNFFIKVHDKNISDAEILELVQEELNVSDIEDILALLDVHRHDCCLKVLSFFPGW